MNGLLRTPGKPIAGRAHRVQPPRHSNRGAVALEFAILAPLMLLIMLGFTEIYLYMRAVSIVEHTAFTIADSLGQMPEVVNDQAAQDTYSLGSLWNAATVIAAPNALKSQGGVIITSICDDSTGCGTSPPAQGVMTPGTPRMLWQAQAPWTQNGMTSRETKTSILPAGWPFRNGDNAVAVEVFYNYTPFTLTSVLWAGAPGTQTIYERIYVRPRSGNVLKLVATAN
jgi:Flp pilus assembly protein TadG